jgi:hypothetical protein
MMHRVKIADASIGEVQEWCRRNCRSDWECVGVYAAEQMTVEEYADECRAYGLSAHPHALHPDASVWRFADETDAKRVKVHFG